MRELAARMPRKAALACVAIVGAVLAMGTVWAFQRGGRDFDVFHHAWGLVLAGRGREIYVNSPDRYLYAPGFAWLLAPLGLLPRAVALGLWCLAKTLAVGWMLFAIGIRLPGSDMPGSGSGRVNLIGRVGVASLGLLLVARPFIVDFGYGQVNVFILAAALWALFEHTLPDRRHGGAPFWSWFALACAAVAKIFPLPLLIIPFVSTRSGESGGTRKLNLERAGVVAGFLTVLLLPILTVGFGGLVGLIAGWRDALLTKGLPLESHNQSFVAFLYHYFTGRPTHVIAEGIPPLMFGVQAFDSQTLTLLSLAWTFSWVGVLLAWLLRGPGKDALAWSAVAVGLLIVPSHLVWKTYFVTGLPLAAWILSRGSWRLPLFIFVLVNLTGYEIIGHGVSARLEAASILLFAQLAMILAGMASSNRSDSVTQ